MKETEAPYRWYHRLMPASKADIKRIEKLLMKIDESLDQTLAKVTEESTIEDSLLAIVTAMQAQLTAALAGELTPAQQAKADAVFAKITENITKVTAAITANTPVAAP